MTIGTRTPWPNPKTVDHRWVVIDLDGKILGRAACKIANLLRGKEKPIFSPQWDTGEWVIVINASKVRLTGNKLKQKMYYNHSGYRGGLTERTAEQMLKSRPEEVIRRAVYGMLPKNDSRHKFLKKLKVYAGPSHPHVAQGPIPVTF